MNWKEIGLFLSMTNYGVDRHLSRALNRWLNTYEIDKVEYDKYYATIYFTNGREANFWKANKWYAYASKGVLRNGEHRYYWTNNMPTKGVMLKLSNALDKYGVDMVEKDLIKNF